MKAGHFDTYRQDRRRKGKAGFIFTVFKSMVLVTVAASAAVGCSRDEAKKSERTTGDIAGETSPANSQADAEAALAGTLQLTVVGGAAADAVYDVSVLKGDTVVASGTVKTALTLTVTVGTDYVVEVSKEVVGVATLMGKATGVEIKSGTVTSATITLVANAANSSLVIAIGATPVMTPTSGPVPTPAPSPVPGLGNSPTDFLSGDYMILNNYSGSVVPKNLGGNEYPVFYETGGGPGGAEGGPFVSTMVSSGCMLAQCMQMHLTRGGLYAQFNPYADTGRDFARAYSVNPAAWKFNTYNRMRIWLKVPPNVMPLSTDGTSNFEVGTYVKKVVGADTNSDEAGGFHGYHNLNLLAAGTWVQILLNQHPDHTRGELGGTEQPNEPHPTGEAQYNYFDTLTRFYIESNEFAPSLPVDYQLGQIAFFAETRPENDAQVRNISETYVASQNRIVVTWFRNKDENSVIHEVRYSFSDIHTIGWAAATPAPNGLITPPGWQGYNGMTYDTTAIDVAGKKLLYIAIKPQNSSLFSQIMVPLTLN